MSILKELRFILLIIVILSSCVKFPKRENTVNKVDDYIAYIYPYGNENKNIVAEITINTDGTSSLNSVTADIPPLKYNKSLLFFLTQDDCRQDAYSSTWAAINGKPLSSKYYYNASQLHAEDLPPDIWYLGKTLGCTDGAGNEIRFHFTTTVAAEWDWMSDDVSVKKNYSVNYYRFQMKSGLNWDNLRELLNYGEGIAFHDVNTSSVYNTDSLLVHFDKTQKIIIDSLSGRGCKTLAEPNGNKSYVTAALNYSPIQIMVAQTGTTELYPFKENTDIQNRLLNRGFYSTTDFKKAIDAQMQLTKENRIAIHVGIHGSGDDWAKALLWLNDAYGKDGNDSIWFPALEEYYEYNYYRIHGKIQKTINNNIITFSINLPMGQYFYYPSVTVNVKGLTKNKILSIGTSDNVTGLSFADYSQGVMINIDCSKFLYEQALHFVEQYENDKTDYNLNDAIYFVSHLKDSDKKTALMARLK